MIFFTVFYLTVGDQSVINLKEFVVQVEDMRFSLSFS